MGIRRRAASWVPGVTVGVVLAGATAGLAGPASAAEAASPGAAGASAGLAWNTAQPVAGASGTTRITNLSCPLAGDCTITGSYTPKNSKDGYAFASGEKNGTWASQVPLPGDSVLSRLSCTGPGDCVAAGSQEGAEIATVDPVVASEQNGTWGNVRELPGAAALGSGGAETYQVSCWSAGNCAAIGEPSTRYFGTSRSGVFTAAEKNGVWQTAAMLPGIFDLPYSSYVGVTGLSCVANGNCVVAGVYNTQPNSAPDRVFVADEVNGTWSAAQTIAGFPVTAYQMNAESLSCSGPGECAVSGSIVLTGDGEEQEAFTASEVNGTWGAVRVIPSAYDADTVSCAAAGHCVAAGEDSAGNAVLITQAHGVWGRPRPVPGLDRLNAGKSAKVTSISCPRAGYCGITGTYGSQAGQSYTGQVFVDTETRGTWGTALEVPGAAALSGGYGGEGGLISCTYPLACTATGAASSSTGFTVSTNSRPGNAGRGSE